MAQDAEDPGVLVLSRFAGRPRSCDGALIVNPYDVYDVAAALDRALTMPLDERRERHASQLAAIRQNDIQAWRRRCLAALAGVDVPAPVRETPRSQPRRGRHYSASGWWAKGGASLGQCPRMAAKSVRQRNPSTRSACVGS